MQYNKKNPDEGLLGSSYLIWAARDCGLVVGTAQKKKGKGKGLVNEGEPKGKAEITTSSVRFVLWALISRCNPGQSYSTFASQETLADDTGLSVTTVKRALDHLIENLKLVDRDPRPYQSSRYYIDVKTMHEAATKNWAEKKAGKDDREKYASPFDQPVPEICAPRETAESDAGTGVDFVRRKPSDKEAVERICMNIGRNFGNHPTYEEPDGERMVRGCINKCVDAAGGDAALVERVLEWVYDDSDLRDAIVTSNQLGGWIAGCFKGWLKDYRASWGDDGERVDEAEAKRLLYELCTDFNGGVEQRATLRPNAASYATAYTEYIRGAVGPHLRSIRHQGSTICAEVSPAYRISRIFEEHTGQKQNTVPSVDGMDEDDVDLAMWAIHNYYPLVDEGPDAYHEFVGNRDEIAKAWAREAEAEARAEAEAEAREAQDGPDWYKSEDWFDDDPDNEPNAEERLGL